MVSSSMNIGASALLAAQRALEVASHNVANATNPGYTRQRLEITSAAPTPGQPGMRGNGVTLVSIERLRDSLADVAYRDSAGEAGTATARSAVLHRAQGVMGGYPDGVTSDLSSFFTAWDRLSLNPADPSARAGVLNAGETFASSLRSASRQLDGLRADVGLRVVDQVAELNSLATDVARLNQAVADAVNSGQQPNDLLDQRDQAVDRLSSLAGVTVRHGANSSLDVYAGGSVLVSGVTTRNVSAGPGGLSAAFTDGAPFRAGGELGGHLSLITSDLPQFQAELDRVATGFGAAVNAAHAAGYDFEGRPGGAFFLGTGAGDLAVDPALTWDRVAAGQSAPLAGPPPVPVRQDGNNALNLAGLRQTSTVVLAGSSSATTVGDALRTVGGRLGTAAAEASRAEVRGASSVAAAQSQRAQANGVSIDEEMVQLVKFQHAYQAAAKVITAADEMMQTLMSLIR